MVSIRGINWKTSAPSLALVVNAFIWYFLAFNILESLFDSSNADSSFKLLFLGVNAGAIAVSAIVGSFAISKFSKRSTFLNFWMLIGVIISVIPLALNIQDTSQLLAISILFGAYFGFGMPSTMGYYSASIPVDSRAKVGGITFMLIGVLSAVIGMFTFGNILISCILLAGIRLLGLILFYNSKQKENGPLVKGNFGKYRKIVTNRTFLLYFIPWGIFSLVNYITIPIINQNTNFNFGDLSLVEYVIIGVVAVICGFLADNVGRKRFAIFGFVMLGLGFAALSLFPASISGYVYTIADGTAWGMFYVIFLITIWGDLAQNFNSEKFYVIGAIPFLFSDFMRSLFEPYLAAISPIELFSFASVFLFVAVLPLYYAPETLSEKIMKERELKAYLEKAQKLASKETDKMPDPSEPETEESAQESPDQQSESSSKDEEARKLAEKYY